MMSHDRDRIVPPSRSRVALVAALAFAVLLVGCAELAMKQKERQMELVARDWCMVIRASQVIPLYPLSQDVQPGDVFLVNRTVADQSRRFRERGFLPTDVRVCRLFPENYGDFYRGRVKLKVKDEITGKDKPDPVLVLPRDWRDPAATSKPWERFPAAGFPSYTFSVSNSGGLSIAVPVQSVPVAFSILGAASATGSLTITQCFTYGLDANTLVGLLDAARQRGDLDCARPPEDGQVWFLRVVTQVYGAKSWDVSLTANSTLGAGVDAGKPQPVGDARASLENGITVTEINRQLSSVGSERGPTGLPIPGVSARATFASGRTIGMTETFVEPMIFGYQGFDVAIDSQGRIGSLIPTFEVVDGDAKPIPPTTAMSSDNMAYLGLLTDLRAMPPGESMKILEKAASNDEGLASAFQCAVAGHPNDGPVDCWVLATTMSRLAENDASTLTRWLRSAIKETKRGG